MKIIICFLVAVLLLAACNFPSSTPVADLTPTLPPILPTAETRPGLVVRGHVTIDGAGLAAVKIYRRFSAYPWELIATTDDNGYYESGFINIPGDEMVSIKAELDGYTFDPPHYYWRHYHSFEHTTCDFAAVPTP